MKKDYDMEQIYKRHAKHIYGFLLSRTNSTDLAEELTQETFYQAVRCIDRFEGKSSVSTWLCGIAKRVLGGVLGCVMTAVALIVVKIFIIGFPDYFYHADFKKDGGNIVVDGALTSSGMAFSHIKVSHDDSTGIRNTGRGCENFRFQRNKRTEAVGQAGNQMMN